MGERELRGIEKMRQGEQRKPPTGDQVAKTETITGGPEADVTIRVMLADGRVGQATGDSLIRTRDLAVARARAAALGGKD